MKYGLCWALPLFCLSGFSQSTPLPSTSPHALSLVDSQALQAPDYLTQITSRTDFEMLAALSDQPGAQSIREVKFLITDLDTSSPKLYLFNTKLHNFHYYFARDVLGYAGSVGEFNAQTYFRDDRKNIAGSLLAHDHYTSEEGVQGLYTLQFWPVDPVTPDLTAKAYKMISEVMPFAEQQLAYFPASDIQLALYLDNQGIFEQAEVSVIQSEALFANIDFSILNPGEGYGRLRVIGPGDSVPSVNDVVVYTYIPNDLAHVAGIITDSPQTPLSHINLKAKQNKTPNAYIKDAINHPAIAPLIGELVHYQVTGDGVLIEAATQEQVDAWQESIRPEPQTPESDLSVWDPIPLSELGNADWVKVGAKAANVAELAKALAPLEQQYGHQMVPRGYAIPFAMYDEYMSIPRCQGLEKDDNGNLIPDGKYRDFCEESRPTSVPHVQSNLLSTSWLSLSTPLSFSAGTTDVDIELKDADGLTLMVKDVTNGQWLLHPFAFTGAALSREGTTSYQGIDFVFERDEDSKRLQIKGTSEFAYEVSLFSWIGKEAELSVTQTKALPESFNTAKSYYDQISEIMADEDFQSSPDVREEVLDDFRKEVKKGQVTQAMKDKVEAIRLFWDADGEYRHNIRLRSSTNNEDLQGFNGAGLYESNTHKTDEGDMIDSVKKVWASLWTHRAFEERRFYRIDHLKTYMGVLAHESYGDEQANGVAVTKNIYDENWEGYYVNVQHGEISVTNPEPIDTREGIKSSVPDEFLLANLLQGDDPRNPDHWVWTQQYIRHSNVETVYDQPVASKTVLLDDEVVELREAMRAIQMHFWPIYGWESGFAMDIEFKITATEDSSRGHLEVKQARPWID